MQPRPFHSRVNNAIIMRMRTLLLSLFLLLAACGQQTKITTWPLVKDCNLHQQACTATQGNQSVTLDIHPKPISVAKPLKVSVTLQNLPAKRVELDISGINMYMGYNRVSLDPVGENRWQGDSMLAFCTNDAMEWQVSVLVTQSDGKVIQFPFYLKTERDKRYPEPVKAAE